MCLLCNLQKLKRIIDIHSFMQKVVSRFGLVIVLDILYEYGWKKASLSSTLDFTHFIIIVVVSLGGGGCDSFRKDLLDAGLPSK